MEFGLEYGRALDCFTTGPAAGTIFPLRPGSDGAGLPGSAAAFVRAAAFGAKHGEVLLIPSAAGGIDAALGLGDGADPLAFGALPAKLPPGVWRVVDGTDLEAAALGFALGAYRQTALKSSPASERALLSLPDGAAADARRTAQAIWFARDLINAPANLLGPAELADAAASLGARFGADVRRTTGEALGRGYPALAAVGAGSDRPAEVVRLDWRGSGAAPDAPHIVLCGKGVCFDTGGYDLKPSSAMLKMKKDMGGAAILLAAAMLLMGRDLPIRLSVLVGCVENSISGHAMRPSDVLRTRRGLSVEVGNTDAEGRLVLADLLAEASDERPALLIDAATLTGAARVALGPDVACLFSNDSVFAAMLADAGDSTGDFVWRMPLHAGYRGWLDSQTADLNTVSGKPFAGAIIAALFLERFVKPGVSWAHLDVFAFNDGSRPGRPEGGEATGLRALDAAIVRFVTTLNQTS